MFTLKDVWARAGLNPKQLALMFHTPSERATHRILPWLAAEHEDVFNAYQSSHSPLREATIKTRPYFASFVSLGERRQLFAGIYASDDGVWHSYEEMDARADYRKMYEMTDVRHFGEARYDAPATGRRVFALKRVSELDDLRGRLIVRRPPGKTYVRLAENADIEIQAILEHSSLVPAPPAWNEMIVTASELKSLPQLWRHRLQEGRGVYLIVDEEDGARYVGAAYGTENLYGRWMAHVAGNMGVTKRLSQRSTARFRFSVLELLKQDAEAHDVIALEQEWKHRLHTIEYGLNEN